MTGLEKRRDVWTRKHELSAKLFGGAGPVCSRGQSNRRKGGEGRKEEKREVSWMENCEIEGQVASQMTDAAAALLVAAMKTTMNISRVLLQTNKLVWLS